MALLGHAVLAFWHDIVDGGDADFNHWHTEEHIPERVGIPGFLRGRRYEVDGAGPRYFNLYETTGAGPCRLDAASETRAHRGRACPTHDATLVALSSLTVVAPDTAHKDARPAPQLRVNSS